MKILHLRSSAGYGGVETALRHLLPALQHLGHECSLVVTHRGADGAFPPDALREQVQTWCVRDDRRLDWRLMSQVARIVRAVHPAIIHSHDYKSNQMAALLGRAWRIPTVATQHGYTGATTALRFYELWDRVWTRRWIDVVVALSPSSNTRNVIFNGVDAAVVEQASREASPLAPTGDFNIIAIGRLSREKGHAILLSALAGLDRGIPWRLALIGDGPLRSPLQELSRTLGISERVCFHGFRSNPLPWLAAADMLALPSLTEQCPVVILEAMALARPVMASRTGATPSLVVAEQTGWVITPGYASDWRRCLELAWQQREQWPAMGRAARARLDADFSIAKTAEQYAALYRDLVAAY